MGFAVFLAYSITLSTTTTGSRQSNPPQPAATLSIELSKPAHGAPPKSPHKPKQGWLYINKYALSSQFEQRGGFAVTPFYIFDKTGLIHQSIEKNNTHSPGKLIPVEPGEYYVAAGKLNQGATRTKYMVEPGKVTEIQTGFVMIQTWKQDELPITGCSEWDGTMHVLAQMNDKWLPIMSNPPAEYRTRHWGVIQLPVGQFRVIWHDMTVDIEIKKDQVYRLPLGIAGPMPDKGAKLASRSEAAHGAASQVTVNLCLDGPTQVLAGDYWLLTTKHMEVFPHEQKEWSEMTVEPFDEHGYVMKVKPDKLKQALLSGDKAQPLIDPGEVNLNPGRPSATTGGESDLAPGSGTTGTTGSTDTTSTGARPSKSETDNLLGGQGIKWDAPL